MEKYRSGVILIGIIFGTIGFAVCAIFMSPQIALLCGAFLASLYILVLSIIMHKNTRKYIDDEQIDGKILLKEVSNYYNKGKLICSGLLYLTEDRLIFISREKKQMLKEEIPITSLESAQRGVLLGHICGLKLIISDGSGKGYFVNKIESYVEKIMN